MTYYFRLFDVQDEGENYLALLLYITITITPIQELVYSFQYCLLDFTVAVGRQENPKIIMLTSGRH